ncbi:MAG: proprotein convertase P-domain-containing protein, partial [Chitinophagales bacterium]
FWDSFTLTDTSTTPATISLLQLKNIPFTSNTSTVLSVFINGLGTDEVLEDIGYEYPNTDGTKTIDKNGWQEGFSIPIAGNPNGDYRLVLPENLMVSSDIDVMFVAQIKNVAPGYIEEKEGCNGFGESLLLTIPEPISCSLPESCGDNTFLYNITGGSGNYIIHEGTINGSPPTENHTITIDRQANTITVEGIENSEMYSCDIEDASCVPNACLAEPYLPIPKGSTGVDANSNVSHHLLNLSGEGILGEATQLEKVCVLIEHESISDLTLLLTSPEGTTITLSAGNGGGNECSNVDYGDSFNKKEVCFTPEGENGNISDYCGGETGNWIPEEGFEILDGEFPQGVWTLSIQSEGNTANGYFISWSMDFFSEDCASSDCDNCNITCNLPDFDIEDNNVSVINSQLCCGASSFAEVNSFSTETTNYNIFWVLTEEEALGSTTALFNGTPFGKGAKSDELNNDCVSLSAGEYYLTPYVGTNRLTTAVFADTLRFVGTAGGGNNVSIPLTNIPFDEKTQVNMDIHVSGGEGTTLTANLTSPFTNQNINLINGYNSAPEYTFTGSEVEDINGEYKLQISSSQGAVGDTITLAFYITVRDILEGYIPQGNSCQQLGISKKINVLEQSTFEEIEDCTNNTAIVIIQNIGNNFTVNNLGAGIVSIDTDNKEISITDLNANDVYSFDLINLDCGSATHYTATFDCPANNDGINTAILIDTQINSLEGLCGENETTPFVCKTFPYNQTIGGFTPTDENTEVPNPSSCGTGPYKDIWFKFNGESLNSNAYVNIYPSNETLNLSVALYSGSSDNLNLINCASISNGLSGARIDLTSLQNEEYHLRVWDNNSTIGSGSFQLCIEQGEVDARGIAECPETDDYNLLNCENSITNTDYDKTYYCLSNAGRSFNNNLAGTSISPIYQFYAEVSSNEETPSFN